MKEEYTVKELCEHYNITRTTSERYRRKGMPYKKRGRNIFFVISDVEEWMEQNNKVIEYNYENNPQN